MRHDRMRNVSAVLVLVLLVGAWACASTPLGKAVQAADAQKQLVEASADEFARLYLNKAISVETYRQGKDAYQTWAKGETALAKSLAEWKRLQDKDSGARLSQALADVGALASAYLDFVGRFVDVPALAKRLGQ